MKLERIKLFPNANSKCTDLTKELKKKLLQEGYSIVEEDYDLAIAIGGDGSYLRMLKENRFNSRIYYIGINKGTLGFLQEIKPDEIDNFLFQLKQGFYKVELVGIQETIVSTPTKQDHFYSLNDIVIRDQNLNTSNLNVFINGELLELYTGDGILIATSIGSTAYNISLGGSIVYSDLHTLQITPIAPLNTRAYRNLLNSVIIPEEKQIQIVPERKSRDLVISVDGENKFYQGVEKIETGICKKKIKCLRMQDYNYTKIINDKFLK